MRQSLQSYRLHLQVQQLAQDKGTVIANLAQFEDAVFITSKEEMTGGNSAINVEVYYRLKPIK